MTRQVNFNVDDRVFSSMERMAAAHGHKATGYAKLLFEAAFAARVGAQPDADIDVQIAAAIVMHGARQDSATIAKAVRLSEATVVRIIDVWRRERLAA